MIPRKFAVTAATLLGVTLAVAGLSIADGESPLEKQMEQINAKSTAIRKATKTVATWKKDGKNVSKDAEEIAKLGKEAKADKGPSEKQNKKYEEWTKLMDDMVKSADELVVVAKKSDTTQAQAKDAFTGLTKTCSACHAVFRVDDK